MFLSLIKSEQTKLSRPFLFTQVDGDILKLFSINFVTFYQTQCLLKEIYEFIVKLSHNKLIKRSGAKHQVTRILSCLPWYLFLYFYLILKNWVCLYVIMCQKKKGFFKKQSQSIFILCISPTLYLPRPNLSKLPHSRFFLKINFVKKSFSYW